MKYLIRQITSLKVYVLANLNYKELLCKVK